jgi:hypothetical protein
MLLGHFDFFTPYVSNFSIGISGLEDNGIRRVFQGKSGTFSNDR